jgi:alpha-tubulin suppressor-like RCC1 family protein
VGHSHAGLLTHGGELYTWGSGNAARLGHGHGGAASTPQRVHTLWGAAATVVKCSDSASAAVSQVSTASRLHA